MRGLGGQGCKCGVRLARGGFGGLWVVMCAGVDAVVAVCDVVNSWA